MHSLRNPNGPRNPNGHPFKMTTLSVYMVWLKKLRTFIELKNCLFVVFTFIQLFLQEWNTEWKPLDHWCTSCSHWPTGNWGDCEIKYHYFMYTLKYTIMLINLFVEYVLFCKTSLGINFWSWQIKYMFWYVKVIIL